MFLIIMKISLGKRGMPQSLKQNRRNEMFKSKQKSFSPNKFHSHVKSKAGMSVWVKLALHSWKLIRLQSQSMSKQNWQCLLLVGKAAARDSVSEERTLQQNQSQKLSNRDRTSQQQFLQCFTKGLKTVA